LVYFCDFVCQKAIELGITGYDKNLPDESVEITAEGTRPALERLLIYLRCGSPYASIAHAFAS